MTHNHGTLDPEADQETIEVIGEILNGQPTRQYAIA
jgi:hypothetical protein